MWAWWTEVLERRRVERLARQFFGKFAGKTLIVHAGLGVAWIEELLKLGGGGGHFRIDVRRSESGPETPVEWLVRHAIVPQQLPLPVIIVVDANRLRVRHLRDGQHLCHPVSIAWILEDIRVRDRVHVELTYLKGVFHVARPLAVEDNRSGMDDAAAGPA